MRILGIETSCDETAASLIEIKNSQVKFPEIRVYSNIVSSQVKIHRPYGGVVPHLAAREHDKNLPVVLKKALSSLAPIHADKNVDKRRSSHQRKSAFNQQRSATRPCDLIAVTMGPGLLPALLRGVRFAKELAPKWDVPIIGVDHMEGHLFSALLQAKPIIPNNQTPIFKAEMKFPAIALLVSGGHTQLWLMRKLFDYKLLGETRDDAVGEAFDKVARLMGLPYPGGPEISGLAQKGNPEAMRFPRPMLSAKNFDFSFSGLKTAVFYYLREHPQALKKQKADVAASFQQAAIETLVAKTGRALRQFRPKTLLVGGGVAANALLQQMLAAEASSTSVRLQFPPPGLAGDNALMIAVAGFFRYRKDGASDFEKLDADPNHRLTP